MSAETGASQPTVLAGTVFEKVAHELAAKPEAVVVDRTWTVRQGAYSRTLAGEPGCAGSWESGNKEYSLVVCDFDTRANAREALVVFMGHQESWSIGVDGAIAVCRESDGTVDMKQAKDHSAAKGGRWGLAAGVLLGVLFPPSALASAAVLGAAGAGASKHQGKKRTHALAEELTTKTAIGQIRMIILVHDERL